MRQHLKKDHKKLTSLHTKPAHSWGQWLWPPISMINWDYFPFFSLKTFMAEQNLRSSFWDVSPPSPQVAASWTKQPFHSYQHVPLEYWVFEWQAAQPEFSNSSFFLGPFRITHWDHIHVRKLRMKAPAAGLIPPSQRPAPSTYTLNDWAQERPAEIPSGKPKEFWLITNHLLF